MDPGNRRNVFQYFRSKIMAHKQQGNLTPSPQWWKHLKFFKRVWHKQERQAYKKVINKES